MRLSKQTQAVIIQTAHEIFNPSIHVKLFGSRLNDEAKGGDIDLLIESDHIIEKARRKSLQLVAKLQIRLGDQAIDILIIDPQTKKQAVHKEAQRTGVLL